MIALLDANNFFVSCERAFRPDLLKKPVAVLSNNDGCLISRSNEVKQLGVPMGAPYFKYKKLLDQHKVAIFSSNFSLYNDMSTRMMTLLRTLAPKIEVYSVDEAFLDLTGIDDLEKFSHHVRETIWSTLGIPTSIGVSHTKVLAKVAAHFSKKVKAFNSVCVLKEEERIDKALQRLDIQDVWGIGRKLSMRLIKQGILKAYDLKKVDPKWMRSSFTVVGERLLRELNGQPCLDVIENVEEPKKSIQVTRSFSKPMTTFEELKKAVANYASRLGRKLRENGLKTKQIGVFIRTSRHRLQDPQYKNFTVTSVVLPIQDDVNLIKAASRGLRAIYREGYKYAKAGVIGLDLITENQHKQIDLFVHPSQNQFDSSTLWQAFDSLNKKYGIGTVLSAACGKTLRWKDKKECLSPAYTTKWNDLPIVRAD